MMMAFYDHNLVYWKPIVALHRRHRAPKPYTTLETTMTVTAYIPVDYAVGQTGVTASGAPATPMVTAAAPAWVPFGTRIWIAPLHQWFTVQDRGGEPFTGIDWTFVWRVSRRPCSGESTR